MDQSRSDAVIPKALASDIQDGLQQAFAMKKTNGRQAAAR